MLKNGGKISKLKFLDSFVLPEQFINMNLVHFGKALPTCNFEKCKNTPCPPIFPLKFRTSSKILKWNFADKNFFIFFQEKWRKSDLEMERKCEHHLLIIFCLQGAIKIRIYFTKMFARYCDSNFRSN